MKNMKIVLAIDPGNEFSAYCLIDKETLIPLKFGKVTNQELKELIKYEFNGLALENETELAIEMIESYGMAVGQTVFETCVWIGRFIEMSYMPSKYVYRKDVKLHLCGQTKAKDSNIRQALIDRFGVQGTKKNQGYFYGFKADIWASYAVGITYIETKGE